jgi:Zn-finger nucleic acid-binding protein
MTEHGIPKPTTQEDEYFAKEDAETKRRIALEMKKQLAADQQAALKQLHFMHCPKCGMKMQEVRYGKLNVDACFACGGVFLDKGEIDAIAQPQQKGIMGAILNWFKDETKHPV